MKRLGMEPPGWLKTNNKSKLADYRDFHIEKLVFPQ